MAAVYVMVAAVYDGVTFELNLDSAGIREFISKLGEYLLARTSLKSS